MPAGDSVSRHSLATRRRARGGCRETAGLPQLRGSDSLQPAQTPDWHLTARGTEHGETMSVPSPGASVRKLGGEDRSLTGGMDVNAERNPEPSPRSSRNKARSPALGHRVPEPLKVGIQLQLPLHSLHRTVRRRYSVTQPKPSLSGLPNIAHKTITQSLLHQGGCSDLFWALFLFYGAS